MDNQKLRKTPVVSLEYDFEHKQRIDNENDKKLVVSAPTKKPTSPTTYTETTTQVPMPTVERQTQQQIIYNAPKQLAGLNGESHDFTTTHHHQQLQITRIIMLLNLKKRLLYLVENQDHWLV